MTASAPKIGVVGAPDVAHALKSLGFDVITDTSFRAAATAISNELKGGPFRLIVADVVSDNPTVVAWATVTRANAERTVVLGSASGFGLFAEDAPELRLELPATFNDLLGRLGYAGTPDALGAQRIGVDALMRNQSEPLPALVPEVDALPSPRPPVAVADSAQEPIAPTFAVPAPAAEPSSSPTIGFPDAPELPSFAVPGGAAAAAPTFAVPAASAFAAPAVEQPESWTATPQAPAVATTPPVEAVAAPPLPAFQMPGSVGDPAVQAIFGATPVHAPDPAPVTAPPHTPQFHAPAASPSPMHEPAPAELTPSDDGYFQQRIASREAAGQPVAAPQARLGHKRGEVIISSAGKGGVGKTSTAILLAQVAAEAGLQAIVIDANRGQADIRKYLRLGEESLPNAYDAYASGDPARAILKPSDYGRLRAQAMLDVPDFGIVLGPPADLADPRFVTAGVYGSIIDYARSIADVVIIDTQIIEAHRTDLWDHALIPMLGGDAWLVAITDESSAGVSNLADRLTEMRRAGVNPARTLVLASQYLSFGTDDVSYFQSKFGDLGTLVGSTGIDDDFHMNLNSGRILSSSQSLRPAIDSILLRVTARADLFTPTPTAQSSNSSSKKSGGVLGMFGKKKSR